MAKTAKINTEARGKPVEESMELNTLPVKARQSARSNKPEVSNAISYTGKKVFKVVCVGDYSGGWSKGVYIEDYRTSGAITENPCNFPVIGGCFSSKALYDTSGQKIRIDIWNLPEHERYFPTNRLLSKNSDGAMVFWGARSETIEYALKYRREIAEVEPEIPIVLVVDNVFQTPAKWLGQGLVINSREEMDRFCVENGFFAWFEMLKRGAGESSDFGQAMCTLINEIIFRNKEHQ